MSRACGLKQITCRSDVTIYLDEFVDKAIESGICKNK